MRSSMSSSAPMEGVWKRGKQVAEVCTGVTVELLHKHLYSYQTLEGL